MVQELERLRTKTPFPGTAPAAYPVFYRTYSRRLDDGQRESWYDVCDRTLGGLVELGKLTADEKALVQRMQRELKALPSGRWLWVGGTEWSRQQKNFSGAYNCTSTNVVDWRAFGLMMDLAMMGCGTGAMLEPKYIDQLPVIRNRLTVTMAGDVGATPVAQRREETDVVVDGNRVEIRVGDSRNGWVMSYQTILELSSREDFTGDVDVVVNLSDVRPAGEKLKGFGGMANPVKLPGLYNRCATILNKAIGRKLNSVECCLLIDEAAACVVAGNIRRSAGMRQFDSHDEQAAAAKDNLWQQDADGNWRIDPERDALRMANHTRVFHTKPSLEEMTNAVRKQFYSGEGAIQWAGEAERRAQGEGRYGLNPCGEILGQNFHCNLAEIHLNQIDPENLQEQEDAFRAGAIAVAALLNHQFIEPRYQQSRLDDPIVGVSFTGLFDFFVQAFGVDWLKWWEAGRPDTMQGIQFKAKEQEYLSRWKAIVHGTVWDYCDRHNIKRPNRCTTVQPAGTKSLLSGASSGWHPPKSQRFIRRITFRKDDPVALACIDYGYAVVPSQSDKDENGNLLNDPFDPRCTEWLVEMPVEVPWANLPGADQIAIEQFSALTQFDFYMQVQRHYTAHNTSATIEFRENEIEVLAERIHRAIQNDEGYISSALLARFDDLQTFPRLPFEPIDKARYEELCNEVLARRSTENFHAALERYDAGELIEAGPAGCDSDKCLLPEKTPG
ncbi:ribonucleoside-triphosphate reductase, adenosylcobalamin-dependent [Leptolyngbyaceae cyanobacterium CCMR0082]|uniref:Adenosylcobalamin-dependent ribonucleoside-triphosphate reductase n=1 Tax=Adonisia turfae CCMR0082 TaxID=2304604 RepID=A0A6M0SC19_9CYAN|nr:ribonucleoside-triphosphate reductase, adenosylcobalamin-dependent [Adonisia turfae]MDV3352893.1 ribonucleoside-triphosphate reductase, adenosylcobalamin-dependent [Leptothoe sp. LEGE 181152]NEZ66039.1 ribonucleoside-triphosphate reductase, adenosylcobalamin-dependent [Adonisia turfae CCMR0082]